MYFRISGMLKNPVSGFTACRQTSIKSDSLNNGIDDNIEPFQISGLTF